MRENPHMYSFTLEEVEEMRHTVCGYCNTNKIEDFYDDCGMFVFDAPICKECYKKLGFSTCER